MCRKAQHTKLVYQQEEQCKEEETEDDTIDRNSLHWILSFVLCHTQFEKGSIILMFIEKKNKTKNSEISHCIKPYLIYKHLCLKIICLRDCSAVGLNICFFCVIVLDYVIKEFGFNFRVICKQIIVLRQLLKGPQDELFVQLDVFNNSLCS